MRVDCIARLYYVVSNDARSRIGLVSSGVIIPREMRRPRVNDYQKPMKVPRLIAESLYAYHALICTTNRLTAVTRMNFLAVQQLEGSNDSNRLINKICARLRIPESNRAIIRLRIIVR